MGSSSRVPADLPGWLRSYTAAWNAHDAGAVTEQMTDDVVYVDLGTGERFEGRAAVRAFVERLDREFSSNYRLEPGQFLVDGGSFAAEWQMSGVKDRGGEQFPATDKPFEIRGVSVGRLRDGKIAENRSYWNLAGYLVQVGLVPGPVASDPTAG
ncbi:nuclear transport factor 2 family protein [Geodermatophilus sp. SYSU D00703]